MFLGTPSLLPTIPFKKLVNKFGVIFCDYGERIVLICSMRFSRLKRFKPQLTIKQNNDIKKKYAKKNAIAAGWILFIS